MNKWALCLGLAVGAFLAFHLSITAQNLATMRTILNNVWDKAGHRLMTTPGVGAQGVFETEVTILNDVWDNANNMLRVSGGGEGGGDVSSNTALSVDGEVAVFNGVGGKTISRATGSGVATLTSGVLGVTTAPVGALVGVSDTQTLTNKTYDAEGAGNVFTSAHKVWMVIAGCQGTAAALLWDTPVAGPAVATCLTLTSVQKGVADFADGVALSVQTMLALPSDWSGAVDVRYKWLSTVTTGSVQWLFATACVADGESDDVAFNTASGVIDVTKAIAGQVNDASVTGVVTTGCAAGELMHVRVSRDAGGGNANDTLAGTASLIGVEVTLRRAQ